MLSEEQQTKIIDTLLKKSQNVYCADCSAKSPCWASLDFGVFICMNCSGAHRSLGPSITRVKSTKLDKWSREWVNNMQIGNSILNQYWESQIKGVAKVSVKPNPNTSLSEIRRFVNDKYVKGKYANTNEQYDPLTKFKKGITIKKTQQPKSNVTDYQKPVKQEKVIVPPKQKQKKPHQDLMNFQIEAPKVLKQNKTTDDSLISFEPVKEQPLFQKNAYSTVSGTVNSNDNLNFDSFMNIVNEKQQKPTPHQHHNNLMGVQSNLNHHLTHAHSVPSGHDTHSNQFVTMNINMNMYPNVMNINLGANQPPQNQPSFTPTKLSNDINLSTTPNLNFNFDNSKKEENKKDSWADQWK